MKTRIKQFKIAATGILSIVALSSVTVLTTVPANAFEIDKTYTLPKAELKKLCTSENDGQFNNHKGGGYGCSFTFPGEDIDIGCTEEGLCSVMVSKEDTSDNGVRLRQRLHRKLQNAGQLIASGTSKKPKPQRKKLNKSASGKLKGN